MAWTYFTSLLNPGENITKDQRNELYDAYEERLLAVAQPGDGLHADMAAVRDSIIVTDRVKQVFGGTSSTQRMAYNLVNAGPLYGGYAATASAATAFTGATFRAAIGSVLGVSATVIQNTAATIVLDPPVSSALYWNIVRTAIQLLKYPRFAFAPVTESRQYELNATANATWAGAVASFYADGESSSSGAEAMMQGVQASSGATPFDLRGWRGEVDFTVPNSAVFTLGYDAWAFLIATVFGGAFPSHTVRVGLGSSVADVTVSGTGVFKTGVVTGETAVGARTLHVAMAGYTDSGYVNEFQPSGGGNIQGAWHRFTSGLLAVITAPTFTHP